MPVSPIDLITVEDYLLSLLFAFIVSLSTTPCVRAIALHYGQVDFPSHRKVHQHPVARVGGIAICLATLLGLISTLGVAGMTRDFPAMPSSFWMVLLGGIGFFAIGLIDDLLSLSPFTRLGWQSAIASLVWMGGVRIDCSDVANILTTGLCESWSVGTNLGWLSLPLTVFWLTSVVNALNWIDGLDGLASGVGSIAAASSYLICSYNGEVSAALVSIALLGSLLGFLVFNFNPAQIFMGDGGSYFVGFILAGIAVTGLTDTASPITLLLPLLILAVPLGDMVQVIFTRLYQGRSPFLADKQHLHHRLLAAGLTHRLAVVIMYAMTCWIASLALLWAGIPHSDLIVSSATVFLAWVGYRVWQATQQQSSQQSI